MIEGKESRKYLVTVSTDLTIKLFDFETIELIECIPINKFCRIHAINNKFILAKFRTSTLEFFLI